MAKVFKDKFQMSCMFTEEGIYFSYVKKDVYFPYGCLDSLNMSLLGVIQAVSRAQVCCFTAGKADKAELKELIKQGKNAMKTASGAEPVVLDFSKVDVDPDLPKEERLKQFKARFVQGMITKEQFNLEKKLLEV